jgi:hypothetical protein
MPLTIQDSETVAWAFSLDESELGKLPDLAAEVATLPSRIAAVKTEIAAAIAKLDATGAWPSHAFSPYHVEIEFGSDIVTKWGAIDAKGQNGRSILINPDDPLRISIGVDLLSSPLFSALKKATNASSIDVLALLLSHETFHLTEADAMSRCGVPYGCHSSGFARAAHFEFSEPWRFAMLALAKAFPAQRDPKNPHARKNSLAIWRAGDIASEACADLFALKLMAPPLVPKPPQATWMQALTAERQKQETSGASTPVDGSGQAANPDYQIGSVLAALGAQLSGASRRSIREAMWREAFNAALLETTYLPDEAREIIEAALLHPAQDPPAPKPLWRKLLSNFKR